MADLAILAQDATKSDADLRCTPRSSNKAGERVNTGPSTGWRPFPSEPKAVTVDENAKTVELPAVDLEAAAREVVAEAPTCPRWKTPLPPCQREANTDQISSERADRRGTIPDGGGERSTHRDPLCIGGK